MKGLTMEGKERFTEERLLQIWNNHPTFPFKEVVKKSQKCARFAEKACPRCHSEITNFDYYNNKKGGQPRYTCFGCRTKWTDGGKQRYVPPREKLSKRKAQESDDGQRKKRKTAAQAEPAPAPVEPQELGDQELANFGDNLCDMLDVDEPQELGDQDLEVEPVPEPEEEFDMELESFMSLVKGDSLEETQLENTQVPQAENPQPQGGVAVRVEPREAAPLEAAEAAQPQEAAAEESDLDLFANFEMPPIQAYDDVNINDQFEEPVEPYDLGLWNFPEMPQPTWIF